MSHLEMNLKECALLPSANKTAHPIFETPRRLHKSKTLVSVASQKGIRNFKKKKTNLEMIGYLETYLKNKCFELAMNFFYCIILTLLFL